MSKFTSILHQKAEVQVDGDRKFYVSCPECFTLVGYCCDTWGEYETEAEAINAWNRRTKS